MATFTPPQSLDLLQPSKQRFVRYATISKLMKEDKDFQVSTLIYCMGSEAEDIFAAFTWDHDDDQKDPDKVMKCFDKYFIPQRNVILERAKFGRRLQEDGQPIETYVRALYQLAENCEYGVNKEDFIRDRLVIGLRDLTLSEQLQMEEDLTLTLAIDKCRHK